MKILYVTSEASPFAASGGLGDVMGALPAAVAANKGNECSVIMPLYGSMKEEYRAKMELVLDMSVDLSWRHSGASVFKLVHNNVTYYFVENHYYFNRKGLYGEFDDAERFAFFSRAVIEFMLHSGNVPDVLHANDWQTAPAIIYLKTEYAHYDALKSVKTVYTPIPSASEKNPSYSSMLAASLLTFPPFLSQYSRRLSEVISFISRKRP